MAESTVFKGKVEWSGENPGISLKTDPEGPFTTLASFFRVVLSPHGRGHALVLVQSPQDAAPPAERGNWLLTDNEPLARYLVDGFVSKFAAFKGLPALAGLQVRKIDSVKTSGDPLTDYAETVRAGDLTVALRWTGLGEPFCFAHPPENSSTGIHYMPSLFVGSAQPSITVNGRTLPGSPIQRMVAGHPITTAMLAFSETWIRA